MKKIARSLVALGLLTALPGFAATPAPVPAAIANHEGPIRIAVIRNLGSDDNTTQFVAGAIQEGKKLGFKVSTFLSNGDDAKFQDFVNQAISQKYDGIILSQGRDPYSTALVKKAVDAGIKVAVFDTAVNGEIPGVTEMTSTSSLGSTNVIVQFDLSRSIASAARDVQAAINAAGPDLPSGLTAPPSFRRLNPADAPVLILVLTSDTVAPGAIYDAADSILAPRIAQVPGTAQVSLSGAEQPAIPKMVMSTRFL